MALRTTVNNWTTNDPARQEAYTNIGRILDHCWKRGVFYSLSFETYNIGGGGTPASFFAQHPEAVAINALGEKARDHEYTVSDGKLIPYLYDERWHSETLDIIDRENWPKWLKKIGVKAFVPQPR